MANNRMYIVCKKCNKYFGMMKYYPVSGFIAGDQGWYSSYAEEHLDIWIKEHEKHATDIDLNGGDYFYFITEGDERVELIDVENQTIHLK